MEVQVKLLRVLQERVIERLGSTQPIKVDVRIIAATNRNLEDAVRDKTFREDLFYRLNVFPVVVPPLRERVEDIPALVWSFVDEFSRRLRQDDRVDFQGQHARAAALSVAGQRPRAAQRHRTRGDRRDRPPAGRVAAAASTNGRSRRPP
jgi:transcriptional regulator with GAF, ATPase, and Fis domain